MVAFLGEFCAKSISFRIFLAFFVALIFNFSPVTQATPEDNKLLEDFSAGLNNNTNWNTSYAVNGLRFCSVSDNRYWVDTSNEDCNGNIGSEPLGSMSIDNENGTLVMDAEPDRTFPYIWSKDINLTSSNDFLLEFRMKYNSIGPHGTGLVFRTWNDSSPMKTNEPFVLKSSSNDTVYFAVWSDFPENSSIPAAIVSTLQDKTTRLSNSPYDFHTFKLESRNDEYRLWVDNVLLASEIIETVNGSPFHIWIGNPLISNVPNRWSSMEIDYIRLTPLDYDRVQSGLQSIFPFLTTNS